MKVSASSRFIGIMGLLLWIHLDFTCGCNLYRTILFYGLQFALKETKPVSSRAANDLSNNTSP